MDLSLLQTPLAAASRSFRLRQKAVERALGDAASSYDARDALVARLLALRDEVAQLGAREAAALQTLRARLRHVTAAAPRRAPLDLDAAIADDLLRRGHAEAGDAVLATLREAPRERHALVDRDELLSVARAAQALRERRLGPALAFAADNASRLRRTGSRLAFSLHLQLFVELCREGKKAEAMAYAEKHLATEAAAQERAIAAEAASSAPAPVAAAAASGASCMQQLQQALALLLFPSPATCGSPPLEALFRPEAWDNLERLFFRDATAALGMPPEASHLVTAYNLGVVALKTHICTAVGGGGAVAGDAECPLCAPASSAFFTYAIARLPACRRTVSAVLCPVGRCVADDGGGGGLRVLPNGRLLSAAALAELTSADGAFVLCAETGEAFEADKVRKAYVV